MISGYVCIRNGDRLDYCWREAVTSLLLACEEVLISDGQSDDGTREAAEEWALREPRVRVVEYAWPDPHNRIQWWPEWINAARLHLREPMQLHLDADEVLDPRSVDAVRWLASNGESAWFERLNYWKDERHLAPWGRACAHRVARLARSDLWMPSDGPADVEPNARTGAVGHSDLYVHHYGFLRRPSAFVEKSKIVQDAFFGACDSRILEAHERYGDWRAHGDYFEGLPLIEATISHPELMGPWLRARGFLPPRLLLSGSR